ncbi:hypothetical protein IMCC14465_02650 [alpha proteobacterium IMCC14465]|uniref:Uncharacterized protein n=1 Tax=alpha proteobacterium IMCC14465 TaxID=1220535 RepID=J9DIX1_9PROT|nr:hypothetical protein IMCC14465_02650 [alpha proteobacterium IMCC14465]
MLSMPFFLSDKKIKKCKKKAPQKFNSRGACELWGKIKNKILPYIDKS